MASAIALFCQDIREEKAGTVTIVGIFPDNISVAKIPFVFPKMAIYARLSFTFAEKPNEIALRLVAADGSETQLSVFDKDILRKGREEGQLRGGVHAGYVGTAILAPFFVAQAGRMNVVARIDDVDTICGTFNIHITDDDSASPSSSA